MDVVMCGGRMPVTGKSVTPTLTNVTEAPAWGAPNKPPVYASKASLVHRAGRLR